jgi:DNA repair protein RadC
MDFLGIRFIPIPPLAICAASGIEGIKNMEKLVKELPKFNLVKEPTGIFADKLAINASRQAFDVFLPFFRLNNYDIYESFWMLLLNQANKPIGIVMLSQGGMTSTVVDIRIACKYAIEALACSVILAHNHPSGQLVPSEPDRRLTTNFKEAFKILDIKLFDHLIISPADEFYSFADECLL